MTQTVALLVHQLMDVPERWKEKNGDIITDGYHEVWLDGSRYGMGAASYAAGGSERDMLLRAVAMWKRETGWVPKMSEEEEVETQRAPSLLAPDAYIRQYYEEFARAVRSAQRSYVVHGEAHVLNSHIQQALSKLDSFLRPMERIEGKKPDANSGGVQG